MTALHVFGDLVVFLDDDAGRCPARRARLDELAGATYSSDAQIFAGTAAELADLLLDWRAAGLAGFRLRPGRAARTTSRRSPARSFPNCSAAARSAPPVRRPAPCAGCSGLPRPANRYAAA